MLDMVVHLKHELNLAFILQENEWTLKKLEKLYQKIKVYCKYSKKNSFFIHFTYSQDQNICRSTMRLHGPLLWGKTTKKKQQRIEELNILLAGVRSKLVWLIYQVPNLQQLTWYKIHSWKSWRSLHANSKKMPVKTSQCPVQLKYCGLIHRWDEHTTHCGNIWLWITCSVDFKLVNLICIFYTIHESYIQTLPITFNISSYSGYKPQKALDLISTRIWTSKALNLLRYCKIQIQNKHFLYNPEAFHS